MLSHYLYHNNRIINSSSRLIQRTGVNQNNARLFATILLGNDGSSHRQPTPATTTLLTTTIREKHSSTQIKRLFRKNPARLRAEARMGIDRTPEPLPPPTYPQIFEPTFLQNGWSAPPPPTDDDSVTNYPFQVHRTKNKPNDAIGFLPVYTKFRKDGTKATTRIKKVTGDRDIFLSELRSVLQLPSPKNKNYDKIRIRAGGTIEVDGNRVREVKLWLAGLGF